MATWSLSEIEELLAVVKAATGPDMVLDARIELELDPAHFWDKASEDSPPVTDSIDAALDLVERMLPGWMWTIYKEYVVTEAPYVVFIKNKDIDLPLEIGEARGDHVTAPLAILEALLNALIAQEPK